MAPPSQSPHVVIVGGGFGGLEAARALARAPVRITLVDARNHHLFQPLLYQVAMAGLSAPNIAAPIRKILRHQENVSVVLAEVRAVDTRRRTLEFPDGQLEYDYLVLAAGAVNHYFGHPEWAAHAPGLKSLTDALDIRRRVFMAFESAERQDDEAERRRLQCFVVIGGGPTGVELAGSLAEMCQHTLPGDFRRIDPRKSHIVLVEGGGRLLPSFSEALSDRARRQLESLGVDVRLGQPVTQIDEHGILLGGERIEARTVLWGAGVRASPIHETLGAALDRQGRVTVTQALCLPDHPEVFVIGDAAHVRIAEGSETLCPGVAPAAMQMGRHAGRNIAADLAGEARRPFRYVDKGQMATIGRRRAVAMSGPLELSGLLAWLAWCFIHVLFLIGFRSRVLVFFEWIWAYFTYQRIARLILEGPKPSPASAGSRDAQALLDRTSTG